MTTVLAERVDELRRDRYHGGSWMARRAVEALAEVANEPAASAELLERLDAAARSSRRAVARWAPSPALPLASSRRLIAVRTFRPKRRRLVNEEVQGLVGSRDRAAASIAIQLRPALTDAFVLTHSASATVREAVLYASPELVICTVSAPFEEGRSFAEELRESEARGRAVDDDAAEQGTRTRVDLPDRRRHGLPRRLRLQQGRYERSRKQRRATACGPSSPRR